MLRGNKSAQLVEKICESKRNNNY